MDRSGGYIGTMARPPHTSTGGLEAAPHHGSYRPTGEIASYRLDSPPPSLPQLEATVAAALETAISLVEEKEAWKVEKEKDGAVVKSRKNGEGRKVWLSIATVPVSADLLWSKLSDTDTVTTHLLLLFHPPQPSPQYPPTRCPPGTPP